MTEQPGVSENILQEIVNRKRTEIESARSNRSVEQLEADLASAPEPRDFLAALQRAPRLGLIAEIKKASPSAGLIRADFDPVRIAQIYERHGAACLSVLTDEHYFQGHLDYLRAVRQSVSIPVMRKEFILDRYQVLEARTAGADCILLIAECLTDEELEDLDTCARELGMQTLIEVYEPGNLERVLRLNPPLLGINNRNLRTFVTDLEHSIRLRKQVPDEILVISESGIRTAADVDKLVQQGINGILVGESLMREPDIGLAQDTLMALPKNTSDHQ